MDDEAVEITVKLRDLRKFVSDTHTAEKGVAGIGDSTERAGRKARVMEGGVLALGRGLQTLTRLATIAAVAVGTGLVTAMTLGGAYAINASSNLTEAVNKTSVVFGDNGDEVQAWAKTLASSFGISSRAGLDAAGVFGNMLVPMGVAQDEAAKMSMRLTELSGDMASFNNASPDEIMEALRSGLSGEAEPLRKYGVFLNEANIAARAMADGAKKVNGQLPQQAKTLAAYNLILEQTKLQQGDVARSAKTSLAVSMNKLKANFENVAAGIGNKFLPYAIRAVQTLDGMLATFDRARASGARFGFAIATALDGAAGGGTKFRDAFVVIENVVGKVWGKLQEGIAFVRGKVLPALVEFGQGIIEGIKPAMPFFENVLLPLLKGVAIGVIGSIVGAWKVIWPVLQLLFRALGWIGTKAAPFKGVIENIGKVIGFVFAGPILKGIGVLGKLGGVLGFVGRIAGRLGGILIGFGRIVGTVVGFVFKTWLRLAAFWFGTLHGIGKVVATVFGAMSGVVRGALGKVVNLVKGMGSKFADAGAKLWSSLVGGIKTAVGAGAGFVEDIGGGLIKFIAKTIDEALPNKLGKGRLSINLPNNPIQDNLPGLWRGGVVMAGGATWVGERGPELLDLPRGARVRPLAASERGVAPGEFGGGDGGRRTIEVPVVLNGREIARAVADDTADDLARK